MDTTLEGGCKIKQAGYQAEIDQASAHAQQAGPLAEATAHQNVVVEETRVAELEAQREEQRLQASVGKPADAKAYEQITLARPAATPGSPRLRPSARRSSCRPTPTRSGSGWRQPPAPSRPS